MASLKRQALSGLLWSGIQKFGALCISFLANLVLVRLLSPEDFGKIGILLVFTAICQACIDGGFASALIQKKDVSNQDYSTVFYWNLVVAIVLMIATYFFAPLVGVYYNSSLLCDILRVQSCAFFINAFSIVQTAKLTKELNFKVLATRTIVATTIASVVAILLAFAGWGVWSLVAKEIINAIVGAILLWSFCKWRPIVGFSIRSFKKMFGFGSMIFISSIVDTIYRNIQSLIIGRAFSIKDLGYYTQAKKMEEIPIYGGTTVLTQVLFPVYSSIADQPDYMKTVVRKNVILVTFFSFPIMMLLILVAKPLLTILFTAKWSESIPLFQILCIEGLFFPLNCTNTEIFKAIGRSDVYFILQTAKRIVSLVIIFYSVRFGLYAMMWTVAATGVFFYIVNIIFTHNVFKYKVREQLVDILPNLILSIITCSSSWLILHVLKIENNYANFICGMVFFISIYIILSMLTHSRGLILSKGLIRQK